MVVLRVVTKGKGSGGGDNPGRWAAELSTAASNARIGNCLVVVGEVCDKLQDLGTAYQEVYGLAQVLERSGVGAGIYFAEELGILPLLLKLPDRRALSKFVNRVLRPIEDYDRAHSARLLETVRCYMEMNRKLGPTAKRMHVHPHTIQYRLQKVSDLARLDGRPSAWFDVELAIRALDLIRPARLAQ